MISRSSDMVMTLCASTDVARLAAVRRMSSTRADQEIEDVWLGCVYA
jgi:hypothetical protein